MEASPCTLHILCSVEWLVPCKDMQALLLYLGSDTQNNLIRMEIHHSPLWLSTACRWYRPRRNVAQGWPCGKWITSCSVLLASWLESMLDSGQGVSSRDGKSQSYEDSSVSSGSQVGHFYDLVEDRILNTFWLKVQENPEFQYFISKCIAFSIKYA